VEATAHRRLGLVLLLAALLAWGALYVARTGFVYAGEPVFSLWDDAMISMRYARNLAAGQGLVWNPGGERVQGFSDPLPTLAMAALHALPGNARGPFFHVAAFYVGCVALGYALFQCWPRAAVAAGFGIVESTFLVVAIVNVHHFIVDAYIWRLRRDPNYGTVMAANPA